MNIRELAFLILPILAFVLIRGALYQRDRHRERKMQLLEEAIRSGQFDRQAIESLAFQLTGNLPPRTVPVRRSRGAMVVLAFGWITLFTGLGVWVLGEMTGNEGACAAGVLVSVIGFGLVTYPFALRELEARRHPE